MNAFTPLFLLINSRYRHSIHNRGKPSVYVSWKPKVTTKAMVISGPGPNITERAQRNFTITPMIPNFTGEWIAPGDSENEVMWRRSVIGWILIITLNGQLWVMFLDFFQQLLDSRIRFIYLNLELQWGKNGFLLLQGIHSKCSSACKSHGLVQGQTLRITMCCKVGFHIDLVGKERQYQVNVVMLHGLRRSSHHAWKDGIGGYICEVVLTPTCSTAHFGNFSLVGPGWNTHTWTKSDWTLVPLGYVILADQHLLSDLC